MRIFTKGNADVRHQMTKEVSQVSSRQTLMENLKHEKANLQNPNVSDKSQVRENIKKWQKALDNTSPEKLSPQARNAMWKRAKLLKDQFTVGMLSTDELHPVSSYESHGKIQVTVDEDNMQSTNSVNRQLAWNKKMGSKVREYKNIMRHLNADDPGAADIEKFRPKRRIK